MAVPAPSGQSNLVSDYPNEAIHQHDYRYDFRVVGSNSYYSLIILIEMLSFGPNYCVIIRLSVKNDEASLIHSKALCTTNELAIDY